MPPSCAPVYCNDFSIGFEITKGKRYLMVVNIDNIDIKEAGQSQFTGDRASGSVAAESKEAATKLG